MLKSKLICRLLNNLPSPAQSGTFVEKFILKHLNKKKNCFISEQTLFQTQKYFKCLVNKLLFAQISSLFTGIRKLS